MNRTLILFYALLILNACGSNNNEKSIIIQDRDTLESMLDFDVQEIRNSDGMSTECVYLEDSLWNDSEFTKQFNSTYGKNNKKRDSIQIFRNSDSLIIDEYFFAWGICLEIKSGYSFENGDLNVFAQDTSEGCGLGAYVKMQSIIQLPLSESFKEINYYGVDSKVNPK